MLKTQSICGAIAVLVWSSTVVTVASNPVMASNDEQIKALMTEYGAGKYDAAFKRCVAILKADSTNMTVHYYMGNLYLKYNKLDAAAAEYKYCLGAGTDTPEAQAAQQGLQAVEQRRAAPPAAAATSSEPPPIDAKVQEQIDRLRKGAEEQIEIKKRILDADIARAKQEMADQVPRYRVGGQQGLMAWRETEAELIKERQGKIDRFTKDFERNKKEINEACEKRISDLVGTQTNIIKRAAAGH